MYIIVRIRSCALSTFSTDNQKGICKCCWCRNDLLADDGSVMYADRAIAALQKLLSCEYEAARTRIVVSSEGSSCSQY